LLRKDLFSIIDWYIYRSVSEK